VQVSLSPQAVTSNTAIDTALQTVPFFYRIYTDHCLNVRIFINGSVYNVDYRTCVSVIKDLSVVTSLYFLPKNTSSNAITQN